MEGLPWLTAQVSSPMVAEMPQRAGAEPAGHIAATVEKQREATVSFIQLSLCFSVSLEVSP